MPLVQSLASSLPHCTSQRLVSSNVKVSLRSPRLMAAPRSALAHQYHNQAINIQRQSTNYQPSIWGRDYIQPITSHISEDNLEKRAEKLKEEVRVMIGRVVDPLEQLELIDVLERLRISYHFENEIEMILTTIHWNGHSSNYRNKSLHEVALEFRLLRQHDNDVSEDVFTPFINESSGDFKSCLCKDIKGILSLYEASYVLVQGEGILEKTRDFTTKHLENYVNDYYKHDNKDNEDQEMSLTNVQHALGIPRYWTKQRVESRWFIDAYAKRHDKNLVLLELAELGFNMLQTTHHDDSPITRCL